MQARHAAIWLPRLERRGRSEVVDRHADDDGVGTHQLGVNVGERHGRGEAEAGGLHDDALKATVGGGGSPPPTMQPPSAVDDAGAGVGDGVDASDGDVVACCLDGAGVADDGGGVAADSFAVDASGLRRWTICQC